MFNTEPTRFTPPRGMGIGVGAKPRSLQICLCGRGQRASAGEHARKLGAPAVRPSSPSRSARPDSISHACFANFFASSAYGFANSGSLLLLLVQGGAAGGGCSASTATNARARVESEGAAFQNWTAVIAVRIVTMIAAAGFAAARVGMPLSTAFLHHFVDDGPFLWRCCFLLGVACDSRTLGCGVTHSKLAGTTYALCGARGRSGQVSRPNRASILQ